MQTRRSLFRLFAVAPFAAPTIADALVSVAALKQSGGRLLSLQEFSMILAKVQDSMLEQQRRKLGTSYDKFTREP